MRETCSAFLPMGATLPRSLMLLRVTLKAQAASDSYAHFTATFTAQTQ